METVFTYEVMGTVWRVVIYKEVSNDTKVVLEKELKERLENFDTLYSRFKPDSLVSSISQITGVVEATSDLVKILHIYKQFYEISGRKFTPCIGGLLEDVGYDREYSLKEKDILRGVPDFNTVTIVDDTHIAFGEKILLDIGAVGKGYCVEMVAEYLRSLGHTRFLVDGSGDVFYETQEETLQMGLEDPRDTTKVIGVVAMKKGAMCASATNRRAWGARSHYLDPHNATSPREIVATWVIAKNAAYADALSSLLFFVSPEEVKSTMSTQSFSYCIMNHEGRIKKSQDFLATFF